MSANLRKPETFPEESVFVDAGPDVQEPSLNMIGYRLSRFVLWIISAFIFFLVIFLFVKQFDATASIQIPEQLNLADSSFSRKLELIKELREEKKNYRDFTLQISQMVLLNLLLPVLTAILGYIFASNKNKE
jgi:flagellar biosynthesis/type III secretory pathway M-ring protein FliF/YscJ